LILLVQIALQGQSQISKDSIKVAVPQLRKILKAAEEGKITKELLAEEQQTTQILRQRISIRDSIVKGCDEKEKAYKSVVENYKATEKLSNEQLDLYSKDVAGYKKKIKKFKLQTILSSGLAIAAGLFVLLKH
jgi:hypothetical protein